MIYNFRVTETREKFLSIESDSLENAERDANRYVESGEFDMDKNMDGYACDVTLIGQED